MLEAVMPLEISSYYGLNTKVSRAKLSPGFSPDILGFHDIDLSQPGIAKTRGGSKTINPLMGIDDYTKLMLHLDNNVVDASLTPKTVTNHGVLFSSSVYKFGSYSGQFPGGLDGFAVLALHGDATPIVDSEQTPKTVTMHGGVSYSTINKVFGTGSILYDGSTGYLTLADSADWEFRTGDFTLEGRFNWNVLTGEQILFHDYASGTDQWYLIKNATTHKLRFKATVGGVAVGEYVMTSNWSAAPGIWYHIAFVRHGASAFLFVNGVAQALTQVTAFGNIGSITGALSIGAYGAGAIDFYNGYMDELRISNGVARWTSAFTLPIAAYATSYLSIPTSTDFDFGTGDFTADGWVDFFDISAVAITGVQCLFSRFQDSNNSYSATFETNKIYFTSKIGGVYVGQFHCSFTPTVGTQYHIAIVRSGSSCLIFINGVSQIVVQDYAWGNLTAITAPLLIGALNDTVYEYLFNGYVDEFRISKGIARWTANFTPPTTAYTASRPLSFAPVRIFDYFKPSTNTHTIIGNGGTKVYTMSLVGIPTYIGSGYSDGEVMDFLNYKDSIYYSNGVDPGHVWDGTTERLWGIVAPISANTFAADSGGGLTGAYQYAYTYFSSANNSESSASPFSAVHNAVSATINLTGLIASTDTQVDKIKIYRTTNGGALFLLVATINNGVTTYADNTSDVDLGTQELPLYNDPPGLFMGIEEWDGRIWGFPKNSTKVSYSNDEFLTPAGQGIPWESFGADNFLDFNLKVYGIRKSPNFNELWVHTTGGIYAVTRTGIAEDPYDVQLRNSTWFTEAHLSIINIYNDQWFMTANNKWMSVDSSGYLSYKSYLIEPTIDLLNKTKRPFIQAVHYRSNSKNQFRAVYAEGAETTFSRMVAANYLQLTPYTDDGLRFPVWEYHTIPSTCIGVVKNSDEEDILYTGDVNGNIIRQDIGTDDDGVAIDWSMSLGWLRSSATIDKSAFPRFVVTNYKPLGDWFFSLRTDFNFGNSGGQVYSIKAAPTGDRFDIDFVFDVSVFAGAQDLKRVCTDLGGDYNYAELTWFGNILGQVFEMHNNTLLSREVEGFRR